MPSALKRLAITRSRALGSSTPIKNIFNTSSPIRKTIKSTLSQWRQISHYQFIAEYTAMEFNNVNNKYFALVNIYIVKYLLVPT